MTVGRPPFDDTNTNDKAYKLIRSGKFDLFWEAHLGRDKSEGQKELDNNLKDLIQRMLHPDP
jgi:hypothetical protein